MDSIDVFKNSFDNEGELVAAIKKHLFTEDHQQTLYYLNCSIEDVLNGRFLINYQAEVDRMFKEWNDTLGFVYFKF